MTISKLAGAASWYIAKTSGFAQGLRAFSPLRRHAYSQVVAGRALVQAQAELGQDGQQVVEDVALCAFVNRPGGAGGKAKTKR